MTNVCLAPVNISTYVQDAVSYASHLTKYFVVYFNFSIFDKRVPTRYIYLLGVKRTHIKAMTLCQRCHCMSVSN